MDNNQPTLTTRTKNFVKRHKATISNAAVFTGVFIGSLVLAQYAVNQNEVIYGVTDETEDGKVTRIVLHKRNGKKLGLRYVEPPQSTN